MVEKMKLSRISVNGFKSIQATVQPIRFDDITILLGANGAGKSNLVSLFKMLNFFTIEVKSDVFRKSDQGQGFRGSRRNLLIKKTYELIFLLFI